MNKSAILHIPMSQYAYGTDEEHVTIRLRTAKDDIKRCRLYFGDRACRLTPVIFTEAEMHVVAGSELFQAGKWDGRNLLLRRLLQCKTGG